MKLHLQTFRRTLKMEKCKNLVSAYKTFKNLLLPKLLNRILRCCTKIVLGNVYLKFVQMVALPTFQQNNDKREFDHSKFNANL